MGEAIHVWEQIKTNLIRHRHEDGLQILIAALISAIMYAIGAVANNRLILSDASKRLGSLDIVPSLLMIVMMVLSFRIIRRQTWADCLS